MSTSSDAFSNGLESICDNAVPIDHFAFSCSLIKNGYPEVRIVPEIFETPTHQRSTCSRSIRCSLLIHPHRQFQILQNVTRCQERGSDRKRSQHNRRTEDMREFGPITGEHFDPGFEIRGERTNEE